MCDSKVCKEYGNEAFHVLTENIFHSLSLIRWDWMEGDIQKIDSWYCSLHCNFYKDVHPKRNRGFSFLHAACKGSSREVVQRFLNNNVDVNDRVDSTKSFTNRQRMITEAYDGYTPLHIALEMSNFDVASLLVEHENINFSKRDNQGRNALHIASRNNRIPRDLLLRLIEEIEYINARCHYGKTALHYAVEFENIIAIEVLLDYGADFRPRDQYGRSPWKTLQYVSAKYPLFLQYLRGLENENARFMDDIGTLMQAVVEAGNVTSISMMIERGANVNDIPADTSTPLLHIAADRKNINVMRNLLQHGAGVDARDANGQTALHALVKRRSHSYDKVVFYREAIAVLLKYRCNLDARDTSGRTALHVASMNRNPYAVWPLLEYGADHEQRDAEGKTPLWYAMCAGTTSQRLRQHGYELEKLRKFKIRKVKKDFTLCDVFFANDYEMFCVVKEEELAEIAESFRFNLKDYPIYGALIKKKIDKCLARKAAKDAEPFFCNLGIPRLCSKEIIKYLAEAEVDCLNQIRSDSHFCEQITSLAALSLNSGHSPVKTAKKP